MNTVGNLQNLGSMALHTLRKGAPIERIVLGTVLAGAGFFIAQRIYALIVYCFFTKSQAPTALIPPPVNQAAIDQFAIRLREQYPAQAAPVAPPPAPPAVAQPPSVSLLERLLISEQVRPDDHLAEALYAYQELKTKVDGEEARFPFLAERFLAQAEGLPEVVVWKKEGEEDQQELTIPPHYNENFRALNGKLQQVGLSLAHVKRSERPIAKAEFRDGSSKDIHDLNELYQIVKLQGPHILTPLEIQLKKQQVAEAKRSIYESRVKIIDKTLSTLRLLLLDKMIHTVQQKHKELFSLFGNNPVTLQFVLENLSWHVLDRALEAIEIAAAPSQEKLHNFRQLDLEGRIKKVFAEEAKLKQAEKILKQILEAPDNEEAVQALVKLLLTEKENSERDTLVKKLQQPKVQQEEEDIQQELGRLEGLQMFYHAAAVGAAVADEGKNALRRVNGGAKKQQITSKHIPAPSQDLLASIRMERGTYGQAVDELSVTIVGTTENAIKEVADHQWREALVTIDRELDRIPDLPGAILQQIIQQGWIGYADKQNLAQLTGANRWVVTKKMILQRLAMDVLEQKGSELLHDAGRSVASLFKTLYGRLIATLLAFDRRTREAGDQKDAKPADRVVAACFDSLLKCYRALQKVKKLPQAPAIGQREQAIARVLENNGDIHPSATNKRSADAVFFGKLIIELLSILQPEGLLPDIRKALESALKRRAAVEPTLIPRIFEAYNSRFRPAVEPWVKPVSDFLLQALQNIIEKQSTHNIASQLSSLMDPVNLNAALVDLLKADTSKIDPAKSVAVKDALKWYEDDEAELRTSLQRRQQFVGEAAALEERIAQIQAAKADVQQIMDAYIAKKKELAVLDMQLVPQLLKRIVIANVPATFAGYAMQFAHDLFELIQYPRILRHVMFNVLEKSVQALSHQEGQIIDLLQQPIDPTADQTLVDFCFSDQQKTNIGNTITELVWSLSPKEISWGSWAVGLVAQTTAKTMVPGHFLFTRIQWKIQQLVQDKFNDPEALRWNGAKLVMWLDGKITEFARVSTEIGMKALLKAQLEKALKPKETSEAAPLQ